jgi:Zn-dependent oligopeptidase
VPLVGKVVDLRRRIVSLLGYKTRADHVLEVNMIKNGDAVLEVSRDMCYWYTPSFYYLQFLADLQQRLRPVGLNGTRANLFIK